MLIEKAAPGGQVAITPNVENYPGHASISGFELSSVMFEQATKLGLVSVFDEIVEFDLEGEEKALKGLENTYTSKTVILALGAKERHLELENEEKLIGKGVSYCAYCDGTFFKNKTVVVVGGGNTAVEDSIYLSGIANKVYLVHRSEQFRAEETLVKQLKSYETANNGNVEFILNSAVKNINGNQKLESVVVENSLTGKKTEIETDGIFIAVGRKPDTQSLKGIINLTNQGYIIADDKMQTNIRGVYAAGDIREKAIRQIVTATSDGAMAAISAHQCVRGG
jgi:thioredoxin reductase (NADPH)